MIIFETPFGSHLFGTNTPNSDFDFKGIFLPSKKEILLPKIPDVRSFNTGPKNEKNSAGDVDREFYALHKYFDMISKGDMNAIEILFAPLNDSAREEWRYIIDNRHKLLSRKCKGFVGYVQRQANTYGVKGDRLNEIKDMVEWLLHRSLRDGISPNNKLSSYEGIEEEFIEFCKDRKFTSHEYLMNSHKEYFYLVCCDRKVPITVTFKEALSIYENVVNQYGNRARAAATSQGVDWKAISHAIRIGEEAIEFLKDGFITFPRPNADYLLKIKTGQLEYAPIAEQLDVLLAEVENLSLFSELPENPDFEWMNNTREYFYEWIVKNEQ